MIKRDVRPSTTLLRGAAVTSLALGTLARAEPSSSAAPPPEASSTQRHQESGSAAKDSDPALSLAPLRMPPRIPAPTTVRPSDPLTASPEIERRANSLRATLGLLGSAIGAAAIGYWYLQLRARKTAANLATGTLWTVNDALLSATALATGQGWAAALPAIFSLGGAMCLFEMWRAGGGKLHFDRWDRAAMVGVSLGWSALLALKLLPEGTAPGLAFASAALATGTYLVATFPIQRTMLTPPRPEEIRSVSSPHAWMTPALPYLMGVVALGCSWLAVSKGVEWYVHLQPGVLFFNNIALVICQSVWARRRMSVLPTSAT